MSQSKREPIRTTRTMRIGLAIFGFLVMGPALLTLAHGGIQYEDYRAVIVFAPFGIMIGLTMIVIAARLEILERRRRKT